MPERPIDDKGHQMPSWGHSCLFQLPSAAENMVAKVTDLKKTSRINYSGERQVLKYPLQTNTIFAMGKKHSEKSGNIYIYTPKICDLYYPLNKAISTISSRKSLFLIATVV